MLWVLPLTTKGRGNKYYFKLDDRTTESWIILSQIRTISSKRLLRKIDAVSDTEFINFILKIQDFLKIEIPLAGEISEAEATNV